mgnify:CR=1 FL=1
MASNGGIDPENFQDALRRRLGSIGNIGVDATNNMQSLLSAQRAAQAAREAREMAEAQRAALSQRASYSYGGGGRQKYKGNGKDTFENFLGAISQRESGGNYKARNKDSGAMGKYQIMPGNIAGPGGWDKEILGYNISTQQFMNSPQLQEQIAQGMLRKYYNQWGPGGAAVAWYAGPGRVKGWMKNNSSSMYTRPQGNYSSISAYAYGILKSMGLA